MTDVWFDDEDESLLYVDALDEPPCPRCRSSEFSLDKELRAYVCEACGLYVEDDEDLD